MIKFDKDTYDLLMLAANWFAAIGTVGAVIASLYFSKRDYRRHLNITATDMYLFHDGKNEASENNLYVIVSATNDGRRPITLEHIIWSIGFLKKGILYNFMTIKAILVHSSLLSSMMEML